MLTEVEVDPLHRSLKLQRPHLSNSDVVILGKLPPPYMGPSIATDIILRSELRKRYQLHHIDTRAHDSLQSIGEWSVRKIARNLAIYWRLASTLRRRKPLLVLIPISQSTIGFVKDSFFIVIAHALRTKVLVQLRGSDLANWLRRTNPIVRWYVKHVLRKAAGAIVLGEKLKPIFRGLIPEDRIFVVANGANYAFPPAPALRDSAVHFLYVANLKKSKGIEDLVRAVAVLKDRGVRDFHVDVIGDWVDDAARATCLDLAQSKSLPIAFHGAKYGSAKLAHFSAADVFVFVPREPEGHPWVIVEALAAGLPVVATDRGAITESVLDGENGIITESSPTAIADAMETLINDPDAIRSMSAASALHYAANFTEACMVERLEHVFEAVAEL